MPSSRSSVTSSVTSVGLSMPSTTNTSAAGARARLDAFGGARDQHPFDADPEPDARRGLAAHLLDQLVVATAAADAVLRGVERLAAELERGARVVVEPAHEPRVDLVRDPEAVEAVLDRLEVGASVRHRGTR